MNAGYLRVDALTGASADETTGPPINVLGYPDVAIYVAGAGTISSGVLTIETATFNPSSESTYSGTWSALTTVTASDVTGGAQKLVGLDRGAYSHMRARVSTAIGGGGTISAVVVAA
jgi:hypothetical protein